MLKDILTKKRNRLVSKRDGLKSQALASEDAKEVRSLNSQIEELNDEIQEVLDMIASLDAEERQTVPAKAEKKNGSVVASYATENRAADDEMEYREAFRKYIQTGEPIVQRGEVITTNESGAAIPVTVMNEVINTVRKRYGNLYNKVTKTNVKGGVEIPCGALQANFKWINEDTVSPRQKAGNLAKISFKYHTAEIRIAQSFLSNLLTLSAFENTIAEVIAVAYMKAMDTAIVKGSGNGQPLGILNDARVTNNVTMTAAQMSDWTAWRKRFFANLPLGYRSGEFIFSVGTVDAYLETMADANNNPIFRQATGLEINDGDAMNPGGRFFGRNVSLVEPDILPDFDTASSNDVIGIFWQPEEYAINENFGFTMVRYYDQETNEWVDKALVVVDGKVLNPNGFWLIKKA